MKKILTRLAALQTTTERAVEDLSGQLLRPKDAVDLQEHIEGRIRRAAKANFGERDMFLLNAAAEMDELILGARRELGVPTAGLDDHLARLEANGPWLEDLEVGDTRDWPVEEVEPGRWASVNHELRMMGTSWGNPPAASGTAMRTDEGVLRRMRRRYDDRYPAPSEPHEDADGPGL